MDIEGVQMLGAGARSSLSAPATPCRSGRYAHIVDPKPAWLDPSFRYFGEFVTEEHGTYSFNRLRSYPAAGERKFGAWPVNSRRISCSLVLIRPALSLPIRIRIFWPAERASRSGSAN